MKRVSLSNKWLIWLQVLAVVGFAPGCNSDNNPKTYQVTGTLTVNGKPVDQATLVFLPSAADGYPATGITDADGKYQLTTFTAGDGAVPGDYTIKVSKFKYSETSASATQVYASSEEELAAYQLDEGSAAPPKSLLPPRYANPATSGLTYKVTETDSTFDINLK